MLSWSHVPWDLRRFSDKETVTAGQNSWTLNVTFSHIKTVMDCEKQQNYIKQNAEAKGKANAREKGSADQRGIKI